MGQGFISCPCHDETKNSQIESGLLTEPVPGSDTQVEFKEEDFNGDGTITKKEYATITNGHIKAVVNLPVLFHFIKMIS